MGGNPVPKINIRDLSKDQQAELCKLLVLCGLRVRITKEKKTQSSVAIPFVEYDDVKGGNT